MLIDVHKIVTPKAEQMLIGCGDCSVVEYSKPTWHGCRTNVQNNAIRCSCTSRSIALFIVDTN